MQSSKRKWNVWTVSASLAFSGASLGAKEAEPVLGDVVITATGKPEQRSAIAGTVQVIDQKRIEASSAKSLTDLLAENAIGFFSEWTPAQTSINLRGGASDGQGRDFRGQVLVLINGRRAGTANLSKLSPADVERVEVVRGPSSVVYGSQNIGGIINIMMKTGRTAPGTLVDLVAGSSDLLQGKLQHGGQTEHADWYIGLSSGRKGDYRSGKGGSKLDNTAWDRLGLTAGLGYQFNAQQRLDVNLRSDGIYDAGFRGSGANIYSKDDRYNQSIDLNYSGKTRDERVRWTVHGYKVRDVDDFRWASPIIRNAAGNPAPGTQVDHNERRLDIQGLRVQPGMTLWRGNDLLLGWDWEKSRLRSERFRVGVPGNPLAQVSPLDNNQTETVNAYYFEDSQKLLDDRLVLRGGVRRTLGTTSLDWTPHLAAQRPRSENYRQTTYSFGGAYKLTEALVVRSGLSTGFRAPTASELAADFTALGGGRIFGNPSLKPETSRQVEIGGTYSTRYWRVDAALFQNVIQDRIVSSPRAGVPNTSDFANNSADIVVRGLELQGDVDLLRLLSRDNTAWRWSVYGNGAYNFKMQDQGAAATANTNNLQRAYKYQATLGTRFGQVGVGHDWSLTVEAVLRGPMWYETEENLLIPAAEPNRNFIHRKSPFTVVNLRGDVEIRKGVKLYTAVRNLFDVNEHPIFIGLDKTPYKLDPSLTNGGFGASMPGREFQVGIQALF
jgi:vitamin B12 transporter